MLSERALVIDTGHDLRDFSRLLWQAGVPHRIVEEAGSQVVLVADAAATEQVRRLFELWRRGEIAAVETTWRSPGGSSHNRLLALLCSCPLTIAIVALGIVGYFLVAYGSDNVLHWLTFQDYMFSGVEPVFISPSATLAAGEYWRLLTPVFLHFGILHIAFNGLWMYEFGRRIEQRQGSLLLLCLFLFTAVGSNITQYLFVPNVVFGGLSGVIYGLVGYCWMWSVLHRGQDFGVPRNLVFALVLIMLLAMTGFFGLLGLGKVANAAHASGLVFGAVFALLAMPFAHYRERA